MRLTMAQVMLAGPALLRSAVVQAHGPAGSGIFAKADTAETVFSNSAGMTRLDGTQISLNGVLAVQIRGGRG